MPAQARPCLIGPTAGEFYGPGQDFAVVMSGERPGPDEKCRK